MSEFNQNIHVYLTAEETGTAAGRSVEKHLVALQKQKKTIRMVFAAAPSQDHLLSYLVNSPDIQWEKIIAFNMDEYLGLKTGAPQLFSRYLEEKLFSRVNLKAKHTMDPGNVEAEEIERFTGLINEDTIDVVCLGIGENGHLAFNDPPVADFNDPDTVKAVKLDLACRKQQVHDECFSTLKEVPARALTLTIPTLLNGNALFCVVIGENKRDAVKNAIKGPIGTACPASVLRTHPNCQYFFDKEAFGDIKPEEARKEML